MILGWDIAGTGVAAGAKVSKFNVGDKVFGLVNFPGHGKDYAEYGVIAQYGKQICNIRAQVSNISFNDYPVVDNPTQLDCPRLQSLQQLACLQWHEL